MLYKVFIAVDCADEQEKVAVQNLFKEISAMQLFNARQLITMYPFFKAKQGELAQLFRVVSSNESTVSKSMKITGLIAKLMKK